MARSFRRTTAVLGLVGLLSILPLASVTVMRNDYCVRERRVAIDAQGAAW